MLSHYQLTVKIPDTDWAEPVLLWLTVAMPTGSGKSTLFCYFYKSKSLAGVSTEDLTWILNDTCLKKSETLEGLSHSLLDFSRTRAYLESLTL